MAVLPDNPPAFAQNDWSFCGGDGREGMALRDWFAAMAPDPSDRDVSTQVAFDRGRNPHNDPHKPGLRTENEIRAFLRYRFADAMLIARAKGPSHD